ncbi:MAG: hypothetical protein ABIU55_12395 [Ferruginibacter sp.]
MESFIHDFESKVFKMTLTIYSRDCNLSFEIFDNVNIYFKSLRYPFYKNRLNDLIDCVKGRDHLDCIMPFYFGMDNKSYLIYTGNGILIGQLRNPDTGLREEFMVTALSGFGLSEYLIQVANKY